MGRYNNEKGFEFIETPQNKYNFLIQKMILKENLINISEKKIGRWEKNNYKFCNLGHDIKGGSPLNYWLPQKSINNESKISRNDTLGYNPKINTNKFGLWVPGGVCAPCSANSIRSDNDDKRCVFPSTTNHTTPPNSFGCTRWNRTDCLPETDPYYHPGYNQNYNKQKENNN